ncbi:MAG TPA: hypothetical protein VKA89_03185 [Solirubrobacterales bacterium]|nr:hypothetical protein [Solirubrobacterales bacterium]
MSRSSDKHEGDRVSVLLLPERSSPVNPDGPVGSVQEAEGTLPRELLEQLWRPSYLERLAASYWRYLRRISLGALRVIYEPHARSVVLLGRRFTLLRFRGPVYDIGPGFGQVTWPIERGILVSSPGRGHLRISVRRLEPQPGDPEECERVHVRSEVQNFYPLLRGQGGFARLGAFLYSATQLRIHRVVTNGFLRSLARLDLPPSAVGALAEQEGEVPLT